MKSSLPLRVLCVLCVLCVISLPARAEPPKLPIVNDTALKIELLVGTPDVEACTTVCGAPDGSFYVGNDPRDGRLSNKEPVNTIVRFSSMGADRKRTVFADKLYSPAGSAWHDGYLYVLHDPLLTRFKDTKGTGVADVREDLITNLGIPPNEGLNDHVVSGFTLGMDGFFYISVGDRGVFEAKSVKDGSTITMRGGGIIRCRTDGTQIEIFSTGTRNHLQVNLDAEDNAFTRDNTDDGNGWWTRLTHHIEGGFYGYPFNFRNAPNYGVVQPSMDTLNAIKQHGGTVDRTATMSDGRKVADVVSESEVRSQKSEVSNPGTAAPLTSDHWPLTSSFLPAMADFGGGSPTGGLCYLSDGLPEQYRGKHFFSEWGKAGVFVTEVARDGATFKLVSDTKLIEPEKGADFRPMQLSVAADGSLLIADWGYGGWKSPRVAGAIWRLSWPEAKIAPRLKDESKATVEELLAALGHPDRDQRLRAQAALVQHGMDPRENVIPALVRVVENATAPEIQRLHSIWSLVLSAGDHRDLQLGLYRIGAFLRGRMRDPNHVVAAQAIRALGTSRTNSARDFTPLLDDADLNVRLLTVIALGRMGEKSTAPSLAKMLSDDDRWVRFAARIALAKIGEWQTIAPLLAQQDSRVSEQASLAFANVYAEPAAAILAQTARDAVAAVRSRAITALGRIAYQPVPYGGHWWGTQPVKSPPPLNSVPWAGTPQALAALTAALGDADTGVRLAAAKAFTQFQLGLAMENPARSGASLAPADDPGASGPRSLEALAALRARLTAESDAAIRRQLIESLGVQKDPQAMDVFRQIALDEKADAEFRDTAIGAVVNIGGDGAKKVIAQLADAKLSPAATRQIITAAGELKVLEAAPALIAHLQDENPGNREFAARSLQQLGPKSGAGPALIESLADKDGKAQAAAIDAVGSFKEKAALPALIALAEKKRSLKETLGALANMPDESAIPVLVETLRDKNTGNRRNAIKALKTMRDKAWPQVEALLATGRVPEELVPEIKNAFESGAITRWKMVGVFENVWDAVHPPEKEMLNVGGSSQSRAGAGAEAGLGSPAYFLAHKYHNAEGNDVGWIDVTADSAEGRVDLEKVFKTNAMVCAYAFTEIDAPEAAEAKLFTSADDEIAVWLNGAQVLNVSGNHGYEPDKNETPLSLHAGKNQLFVKIGNKGGSWVFHARMPGFDDGKFIKSKEPAPDEKQRLFALATKPDGSYVNAGDAKNGEKIFYDPTGPLGGICATCHAVKGNGGQVGPDLGTIAANYKRPDLITSIHEPSKTIALGFEQFIVETKGGEIFAGAVRQDTADALTLVGADAQSHVVKKAEVKAKTAVPVSIMPQGLTLGLKPHDFADLLAFLETLNGK